MNTKELGDEGERIACEYLVKKGFKIIGRNYRIKFGEIDIIAKKRRKLFSKVDKTIHFVEVKTIIGSGGEFYPEEHVDFKKKRKLKQMAEIWLGQNNYPQDFPYQIDVIGILADENGKVVKLDYFLNAVEDY